MYKGYNRIVFSHTEPYLIKNIYTKLKTENDIKNGFMVYAKDNIWYEYYYIGGILFRGYCIIDKKRENYWELTPINLPFFMPHITKVIIKFKKNKTIIVFISSCSTLLFYLLLEQFKWFEYIKHQTNSYFTARYECSSE